MLHQIFIIIDPSQPNIMTRVIDIGSRPIS